MKRLFAFGAINILLCVSSSCVITKSKGSADAGVNMDSTLADGSTDAGPCGGCSGATPLCDTVSNTCVACLTNADCTDVAASVCNAGVCGGCADNTGCSHLAGVPVCDTADSTCVECTTATESTNCSGNSCNPTTRECTTTAVGSLGVCETCVSDTECTQGGGSLKCVGTDFSMSFHGNYCLREASGSCSSPYDNPASATSIGGVVATYCFPPPKATCESVIDYNTTCNADSDCGASGVADGLCRSNSLEDKCTYVCSSTTHCSGLSCSTESTRYCCTGGSGAGCP